MPAAVGVPLIVMVFDAKLALTPAGKPFAPDTPLLEIPVAPVVVCVMLGEIAVLIHFVVVVPAVAVLFGLTVKLNPELKLVPEEKLHVCVPLEKLAGKAVTPAVEGTVTFAVKVSTLPLSI